jgi:uncharacterized membrane protein YidH (DUF202 family)
MIAALAGLRSASSGPTCSSQLTSRLHAVLYSILGGIGWAAGSVTARQVPESCRPRSSRTTHHSTNVTDYLLIIAGVFVLILEPDGLPRFNPSTTGH